MGTRDSSCIFFGELQMIWFNNSTNLQLLYLIQLNYIIFPEKKSSWNSKCDGFSTAIIYLLKYFSELQNFIEYNSLQISFHTFALF